MGDHQNSTTVVCEFTQGENTSRWQKTKYHVGPFSTITDDHNSPSVISEEFVAEGENGESYKITIITRSTSNIWHLKKNRKNSKIIMENDSGPCSFIAICNIFILRGEIEIPAVYTSVSYEYLSELRGVMSLACEIMPLTQDAVYLHPEFADARSFNVDEGDGELKRLLNQLGIELVHGWVVDPGSPEKETFAIVKDTDTILKFFSNTPSQLTRYGLTHLASTTKPGTLIALFRDFHLSVLYKRDAPDDPGFYSLVTDHSLLKEPSVVWERMEDIDGGSPTFVDSWFVKSSPAVEISTAAMDEEEERRAEEKRRAEEQCRAEEKRRAKEELWRRVDEECLAQIAEWRQKRKQLRAERQQAEQQPRALQRLSQDHHSHAVRLEAQQQLAARFDRAELGVEDIMVTREASLYRITFYARSRQSQQPTQQQGYIVPTSEFFDRAELEAEDIDITVSREVQEIMAVESYQARPRLKQSQRKKDDMSDVSKPSLWQSITGALRRQTH
ncbi:hypothetical protein BDP27DRAFT_1329740 [Rhodocollybia butyracea]|uniref:MINDY deubiquitinase domain-containing protein n=1 Tax=Rhodocollybia butyracea TaxID=206335 RepID=A0A9P5PPB7_9AGAR|nr:hypothetical protein BDP27DRAFT_1329740 [Rhodocollybia butyracea]